MAKRKKKLTYADSGVDIQAGDAFASSIGSMMRRTFGPRVISNPGGFAGLFRLDYNEKLFQRNYRDPVLVACTDGVGTKLKLASTLDDYSTIGVDLVAMCVNDLVVQGAEPLFFLDYVAIPRVDQAMLSQIVSGIAGACRESGCALLGGETAEMPDVYPAGEFDLAGFSVGVVELHRATDPMRVQPGDVVLGLASSGVHSNGYSLVRRVVDHASLKLGKVYEELDAQRTLGQVLLTPTKLYADPIVNLLRAYRVKKVVSGMAHITGGGLASNLSRVLGNSVDAKIKKSAWKVPGVFRFLQEQGGIDEAEMWKVFNMGIGYVLIVRPSFADSVSRRLERMDQTVYRIGSISSGSGCVTVK